MATGKTRNGLNQALAAAGYGGWFDATRAANETASKPDPLMLLQLMQQLQATPESSLMVGDSIHDLAMAQNAGMPSIAVTSGANDREDLLPFQPLQIVDCVSALRTVLL